MYPTIEEIKINALNILKKNLKNFGLILSTSTYPKAAKRWMKPNFEKREKITFWKLKSELDDEMMGTTAMENELKEKDKELNLTLNLTHLIDLDVIHHDFALASIKLYLNVSVICTTMPLGRFPLETPFVKDETPTRSRKSNIKK